MMKLIKYSYLRERKLHEFHKEAHTELLNQTFASINLSWNQIYTFDFKNFPRNTLETF